MYLWFAYSFATYTRNDIGHVYFIVAT
uniref:Uncharacterized protein n=1 Tax=Arundo donax TaxID=35708 RepID=A0A0A9AXK0_ARUDO